MVIQTFIIVLSMDFSHSSNTNVISGQTGDTGQSGDSEGVVEIFVEISLTKVTLQP